MWVTPSPFADTVTTAQTFPGWVGERTTTTQVLSARCATSMAQRSPPGGGAAASASGITRASDEVQPATLNLRRVSELIAASATRGTTASSAEGAGVAGGAAGAAEPQAGS